jgi:putative radical SAM enzyme (TIGR03279 family)
MVTMVRIAHIEPGSIADELRLEIGSRIIRINGQLVRDGIDFRFLGADAALELEVAAPGSAESVIYEIERGDDEELGVIPAPDPVRECANKCVFCFIDGNPAAARRSLHLKDDDFRLSFTYGSYVTLTNLGPRGFQRLMDQRLSPLYVSVHATEPAVRMRLLGVPRGGDIVEQLRQLTSAGIEVHTQIVLCPEWNDGAHLDRSLADLWALGERVLSVSVVPVGLTRYNLNRPVRLLTTTEAARALAQVAAARQRALTERGIGWAYAADEMFYLAGAALPQADYYDDWPLTENGVGAVRSLLSAVERDLPGVRPAGAQRVAVVTGTRMGPVLAEPVRRLASAAACAVDVVSVTNEYFGDTVTTAGLLAGRDILSALAPRGRFGRVLLPAEALNDDHRFIDDMPLSELEAVLAPARVAACHELVAGFLAS